MKIFAPKSTTDTGNKSSTKYYKFIDVLSLRDLDRLLLHHLYDLKIPLPKKNTLFLELLYSMSKDKQKCLKKYFKKHFDKSFIDASFFFSMFLVLFTRKPKESFQFYAEYRLFNVITINNQYLLLCIKKTLKCICEAKIYDKINKIAAFNYLQIEPEEE